MSRLFSIIFPIVIKRVALRRERSFSNNNAACEITSRANEMSSSWYALSPSAPRQRRKAASSRRMIGTAINAVDVEGKPLIVASRSLRSCDSSSIFSSGRSNNPFEGTLTVSASVPLIFIRPLSDRDARWLGNLTGCDSEWHYLWNQAPAYNFSKILNN